MKKILLAACLLGVQACDGSVPAKAPEGPVADAAAPAAPAAPADAGALKPDKK
jgi:hypothetical protein